MNAGGDIILPFGEFPSGTLSQPCCELSVDVRYTCTWQTGGTQGRLLKTLRSLHLLLLQPKILVVLSLTIW